MSAFELSIPRREHEVSSAGLCWGAIIGGSFVAAALSLIMLALGAGFGLSVVSPWSNVGASAAAAGTVAIVWLIVTQVVACVAGGYLAGRLRTRWHSVHNDEVHFRDTANGFLVWAVSVVIAVAVLASAAATMAGAVTAGQAGKSEMSKGEGSALDPQAYYVDRLFRSGHPVAENDPARAEAARIFARTLAQSDSSTASDTSYLAQLVSTKTGIGSSEAEKRVSDTIADAKQAEDTARKATAHLLLWIFLALLIGAFCASYAATIGGRQRDRVQHI